LWACKASQAWQTWQVAKLVNARLFGLLRLGRLCVLFRFGRQVRHVRLVILGRLYRLI
jgi:hypothetical protein